MEINKPEPACPEDEAYIQYIDDHRKNVLVAFYRFAPWICLSLSMLNPFYKQLRSCVANHDLSKYEKEEFGYYRQFFFPEKEQIKDKLKFLRGWQHHYRNNKHHWEYWVDNNTAKEMDKTSVAEMILDWIAMSLHFKTNPMVWYKQNKNRMVLGKQTRKSVETIMENLSKTNLYPFSIRYRNPRQDKK